MLFQAETAVDRPEVFGEVRHYLRPQRIGVDVQEDRQQLPVLDGRALEMPFPHLGGCRMPLVVSPRVSHGEQLEDPADRLAVAGADQQEEMVGHEAASEEAERVSLLSLDDRLDES